VFVPCPTLLSWAIILFLVSRCSHLVNPHTQENMLGEHAAPSDASRSVYKDIEFAMQTRETRSEKSRVG